MAAKMARRADRSPLEVWGMAFSKAGIMIVSLVALAASGCQSSRFSSVDTAPAPLPAAPSGTVTSGSLPPPAAPGTADATQFPAAPGTGTDVAAATAATPPADAPDLTPSTIGGVWTVSV